MAAKTLPAANSILCRIVYGAVSAKPGISGSEIRASLPRANKKSVNCALRSLIVAGQVSVHPERSEFRPAGNRP